MAIEVVLNSPLAAALHQAIQPKLVEIGWGTGDDAALAEYIVLMLVNGKDQEQVALELANDLLSLAPDDVGAHEFSRWLFEQIPALDASLSGPPQPAAAAAAAPALSGDHDMDMMVTGEPSELNAPTGPRSMRNGNTPQRGGRDKRMLGHMVKAMDRSQDSLHRIRGTSRIDSHGRGPPSGPRGGAGPNRNPRGMNHRTANLQAGLANMAGMPGPGGAGQMANMTGNWAMQTQPSQMDILAIMEQQSRMMEQLSQAMANQQQQQQNGGFGHQRHGRGRDGNRGGYRGAHRGNHQQQQQHQNGKTEQQTGEPASVEGDDIDMTQEKREAPNPEDTVCKFNLRCTNKDCKFAHQSPAAPPGAHIDINDVCTFGAACKNRKCVGRHPSPAARLAHQGEQDCKFFPNCQNPQCPFRHPNMPLCRNGANCTTPNCKFTHVKTKCRYNPCLNRTCPFSHEEGQQGGFKDKVWTADGTEEHVSERKFVDDEAESETILPDAQETEVIG